MSFPAAILAGGRATRLFPLTQAIPKSLLDVAGKPFVVHQIDLLRRNGIDRIVLCVGHLGEMIQDALGDGQSFGVQIDFVFDRPVLLGTGGALKRAVPVLGDAFYVLYGDSYLDFDYQAARVAFERSGKLGLMTVHRNAGKWDRSNALCKDGRILCYNKRSPTREMEHIDYGLGLLQTRALESVPDGKSCDLADVYQRLIAQGELAGFEVVQRFYEIGSPEGLEETRSYLSTQQSRGG